MNVVFYPDAPIPTISQVLVSGNQAVDTGTILRAVNEGGDWRSANRCAGENDLGRCHQVCVCGARLSIGHIPENRK